MKLVIEGYIEGLNTRQDNSWVIKLGTQELASESIASLSELKKAGGFCKVLISNTNITKLEEELVDKTEMASIGKNKTASQRLRAVIFRLHEQSGLSIEFDDFYRNKMEELITHFKSKLE